MLAGVLLASSMLASVCGAQQLQIMSPPVGT
jgi:hypothetical protein